MRAIDADALKSATCVACGNGIVNGACCNGENCTFIDIINEQPTIEPEVRRGNGCSYCKGRAYSKKPLTVITRTMKRVEVVFEYCPACGKKMNRGDDNG